MLGDGNVFLLFPCWEEITNKSCMTSASRKVVTRDLCILKIHHHKLWWLQGVISNGCARINRKGTRPINGQTTFFFKWLVFFSLFLSSFRNGRIPTHSHFNHLDLDVVKFIWSLNVNNFLGEKIRVCNTNCGSRNPFEDYFGSTAYM